LREQRVGRWRAFALTWLAYAGFYFCRKNFSVAMPLLKSELGFTTDNLAWILFGYNLCYMLGQFGNGLAAGRWGPRAVVVAGMIGAVVANVLMGFSSGFGAFLVLASLHGYAQATGWPGTCQIMANWFRRRERGIVMAWWSTNYVLGGFLATLFATWCVTTTVFFPDLGWRRGFWWPAIVFAVIALIFWRGVQVTPAQAKIAPLPREESDDEPADTSPDSRTNWADLRPVFVNPAVWIAGGMYFFLKLTRYAFLFWLPVYLTEALHYSMKNAGNTSAAYELFGIGGTLAAGYLSDRVFGSRRFPVGALMLFGLAICCLAQPALASLGLWGTVAGIALIGFMTYGPDTLMTGAAPMDMGTKKTAAAAVGIITGLGSAGQLMSSLVVAWVSQRFGWSALFHLFVGCALVGGLLLLTQWNYGGRKTAAPPLAAT
jgi:OPA family sugar phosphate sensor protein UhpC-like MFS transporter